MLEKDKNAEITDFFRREGLSPNVRFTTWDDYAILSIAESGLGVSLLPRLIFEADSLSGGGKRNRSLLPSGYRPCPA